MLMTRKNEALEVQKKSLGARKKVRRKEGQRTKGDYF